MMMAVCVLGSDHVVEGVRREAEALAVEIARGGEFVFAME